MKSFRDSGDFDDNIYGEILSWLPVKSLVRFKCVSKGWQFMISNDNYFIELHLSRTKTRSNSSTVMVIVRTGEENTIGVADLFKEVVHVRRSMIQLYKDEHVLKPVNGLICSYYNYYYLGPVAFRIGNVMTREQTPWIVASMTREETPVILTSIEERIPPQPYEPLVYGFGFDITTKEHKVICIWQTTVEAPGGETSCLDDIVCKVMTVGRQNYTAWRTIDDFPPYKTYGDGIFVNTSLYWLSRNATPTSHRMNNKSSPPTKYIGSLFQVIVVFDVASEKFRSIPIPSFIMDQPDRSTADLEDLGHPFGQSHVQILEVEGHIALVDQVTSNIVKLWIFDEDGNSHEKISTNITVASRYGNWIEETILIPFGPLDVQRYSFESITGTNQLIIGVWMPTTLYTLHLYDRKKKNFTQVEINGMPRNKMYASNRMANFKENLLRVPKQLQQQLQKSTFY